MNFPRMIRTFGAPLMIATGLLAQTAAPRGWFAAGSKPRDYEMRTDSTTMHGGRHSALLRSIVPEATGFGTLMQTITAERYRGQRVRFSGFVRSQDVAAWAGLWMRVDGRARELLAFDNMYPRPIRGTTNWTEYAVVLDVPMESDAIAFGLLLNGTGTVWMDDLKLEIVGSDVPTTDVKRTDELPKSPKLDL